MEYMIFATEEIANNAELAIRQIGGFPVVGINAKTNLPEPDKQKTVKWATPQQRKDGKWVIPRLPLKFRNQYKEEEEYFDANFPHIIEESNGDWFEQELIDEL